MASIIRDIVSCLHIIAGCIFGDSHRRDLPAQGTPGEIREAGLGVGSADVGS